MRSTTSWARRRRTRAVSTMTRRIAGYVQLLHFYNQCWWSKYIRIRLGSELRNLSKLLDPDAEPAFTRLFTALISYRGIRQNYFEPAGVGAWAEGFKNLTKKISDHSFCSNCVLPVLSVAVFYLFFRPDQNELAGYGSKLITGIQARIQIRPLVCTGNNISAWKIWRFF